LKEKERRQRDQAQRRGDYGAPDAEGHVKRPYDRFSHSSASYTKEGGRPKKGGQGPRNWGNKDTSVEPVFDESKEAEPEAAQEKPADAEVPAEGAEAKEEEKQPEEEDNEIDYATYLERKKKEGEELRSVLAADIRKVEEGDLKGLKPLTKDEENFFPIDGKKKNAAKKTPQPRNDKVQADDLLHFQAPPQPRDGRDNRRGRGRGDRQRQGKRGGGQVSLSLTDDSDFPSLGVKA